MTEEHSARPLAPEPRPWRQVVADSDAIAADLADDGALDNATFTRIFVLVKEAVRAGELTDVPQHRQRVRKVLSYWASYLHASRDFTVLTPPLGAYTGHSPYAFEMAPGTALDRIKRSEVLRDTSITGASWTKEDLSSTLTVIKNCRFVSARLAGVELPEAADLSGTSWLDSRLRDVQAPKLEAPNAFFQDVELKAVDFTGANLEYTIFNDVRVLAKSSFRCASFHRAYLGDRKDRPEHLDNAGQLYDKPNVFRGVDFLDANFAYADLRGTRFERCDFRHADLRGALTDRARMDAQCRLDGALVDAEVMASALLRPEHRKVVKLDGSAQVAP